MPKPDMFFFNLSVYDLYIVVYYNFRTLTFLEIFDFSEHFQKCFFNIMYHFLFEIRERSDV